MFALPHVRSIPVIAEDCNWEGEACPGLKMVTVQCSNIDDDDGAVSFVLKNEDIHDDRILVRIIETTGKTVKVAPLAEYVPFAWGIFGKPSEEFLVPSDSLLPD